MYLIRDSREKIPYITIGRKRTYEATLPTGDYSLMSTKKDSYSNEDLKRSPFLIDRKSSVSELAGNITKKHFWDAMSRLSEHPRPILLFEFSEADVARFPNGCGLPPSVRRRIRIKPAFIFLKLDQLNDMGIEIIWGGSRVGAQDWLEQEIKKNAKQNTKKI